MCYIIISNYLNNYRHIGRYSCGEKMNCLANYVDQFVNPLTCSAVYLCLSAGCQLFCLPVSLYRCFRLPSLPTPSQESQSIVALKSPLPLLSISIYLSFISVSGYIPHPVSLSVVLFLPFSSLSLDHKFKGSVDFVTPQNSTQRADYSLTVPTIPNIYSNYESQYVWLALYTIIHILCKSPYNSICLASSIYNYTCTV